MSVRYKQNPTVEAAALQDETILLDLDTNQFCILNHTASVIWAKVAQIATSGEIAAHISAQFEGVSETDALRDVEETLSQMLDRRLISQA